MFSGSISGFMYQFGQFGQPVLNCFLALEWTGVIGDQNFFSLKSNHRLAIHSTAFRTCPEVFCGSIGCISVRFAGRIGRIRPYPARKSSQNTTQRHFLQVIFFSHLNQGSGTCGIAQIFWAIAKILKMNK